MMCCGGFALLTVIIAAYGIQNINAGGMDWFGGDDDSWGAGAMSFMGGNNRWGGANIWGGADEDEGRILWNSRQNQGVARNWWSDDDDSRRLAINNRRSWNLRSRWGGDGVDDDERHWGLGGLRHQLTSNVLASVLGGIPTPPVVQPANTWSQPSPVVRTRPNGARTRPRPTVAPRPVVSRTTNSWDDGVWPHPSRRESTRNTRPRVQTRNPPRANTWADNLWGSNNLFGFMMMDEIFN